MKNIILYLLLVPAFAVMICISCRKEPTRPTIVDVNKSPVPSAGPDQILALPDSILLDGTASGDPDGKITAWLWTRIYGVGTVSIATTPKATVKISQAGLYKFVLKVTDDGGLSASDTVVVNLTGLPPIAKAGADQTLMLPQKTTTLDGTASSDPNNDIIGYLWKQVSGPACGLVDIRNVRTLVYFGSVVGVCQFELSVTDAGGLVSRDTVAVSVQVNPNSQWHGLNSPPSSGQEHFY